MRAVLGIDAAWTEAQPSGVALAVETTNGWRLVAVAPSYEHFHDLAADRLAEKRPVGSTPDANALLASASAFLGGCPVDLVAIDMPLDRLPIVGRRASDNAISRAYGQRWASTHTPSVLRPGQISDRLRTAFEDNGYPLRTSKDFTHGLIEVYPHPAVIEFCSLPFRSPYKHAKRTKYWPHETPLGRKTNLWCEWRMIISALSNVLIDIDPKLPAFEWDRATSWEWKAYEDMLDSIICVAVGICALNGLAVAYGDHQSAIWVPQHIPTKPPIIGVRTG